jgi:hypothetical protein
MSLSVSVCGHENLALLPPILYRESRTEEEMSSEDRRAPGMSRTPFEGLVEVGGALGPAFEAQAVNVSEDGMMLRTAYLPEAGQPLTCRFDAGSGGSVLASGEVVWTQAADKGGEFAIRFTDMDPESVDALKRVCGLPAAAGEPAPVAMGSKVRLHIEGLASPMRAKIKDSRSSEIRVGSDLGFLQVGKALELEDAVSGTKRPACIDRVEVEVDPASHVPQLVVTLRYAEAGATTDPEPAKAAPRPGKVDDLAAVEEAGAQMKGAVARNFARVGPAMEKLAQRAKTTIALLAARASKREEDVASPRRTTAPAPGGGLHATGKKVIRGEAVSMTDEAAPPPKMKLTKRNAAIASAVMIAAILGAIALKKTHHEAPTDATATATPEGSAGALAATAAPATPPPLTAAPETMPAAPQPLAASPFPPAAPPATPAPAADPIASNDDPADEPSHSEHHKHVHVTPFGNGPVHHGNVLRLKMDGPIEAIEGAQQPTGFTVKVPGHKSLEPAGPLASRDSRIAAIKVENAGAGAELTVAFKDGVPNYQVRAAGDSLVIALAPAGDLDKTVARKDGKGEVSSKHHKGSHKKN